MFLQSWISFKSPVEDISLMHLLFPPFIVLFYFLQKDTCTRMTLMLQRGELRINNYLLHMQATGWQAGWTTCFNMFLSDTMKWRMTRSNTNEKRADAKLISENWFKCLACKANDLHLHFLCWHYSPNISLLKLAIPQSFLKFALMWRDKCYWIFWLISVVQVNMLSCVTN